MANFSAAVQGLANAPALGGMVVAQVDAVNVGVEVVDLHAVRLGVGEAIVASEGVYLKSGGSVANSDSAALIAGKGFGIFIGAAQGAGGVGDVTNAGTIKATGSAGVGVQFYGS